MVLAGLRACIVRLAPVRIAAFVFLLLMVSLREHFLANGWPGTEPQLAAMHRWMEAHHMVLVCDLEGSISKCPGSDQWSAVSLAFVQQLIEVRVSSAQRCWQLLSVVSGADCVVLKGPHQERSC